VEISGVTFPAVSKFAIFIDTHRDQPHVPSFEVDIHRGMARPTLVHYIPAAFGPSGIRGGRWAAWSYGLGSMVRVEDEACIPIDPKHKFVTIRWWQEFLTEYMMDHGASPVSAAGDTKGQLATSHLRNARTKVYRLKSLRQIIAEHEDAMGGMAWASALGRLVIPVSGRPKKSVMSRSSIAKGATK
jgi:hypothetical protein